MQPFVEMLAQQNSARKFSNIIIAVHRNADANVQAFLYF